MNRLLLLLTILSTSTAQAAPVHPMVPMFHRWDYEKANELIDKVAATGAKRVQFTILLLCELDAKFKVKNYGAVWPRDEGDPKFQPMTAAMLAEIKTEFTSAFRHAVEKKLEIAILPQLDAGGTIQEWRNFFDFDPTEQLAGFSYETVMLQTIMEALEAAVPPGHPVEMTLEGEMGCTLFAHPSAWHQMLKRLRNRGKLSQLRLGISTNYEGVNGKIIPNSTQQSAMQQLIAEADFVGISCYCKTGAIPDAADFQRCVESYCREYADLGCPIPESKPLRFTELGLGGGGFDKDWKLVVPSPTPESMGKAAFFGTDELEKNPWLDEERSAYRRLFYKAALDFLKTQPAKWQVENAYLWSYGSFDVHGLKKPEFGDVSIAADIARHNQNPPAR